MDMKVDYAKERQKTWLIIAVAGVVLVVATAMAANQQYGSAEIEVLRAVYGLPGVFIELVYGVTQAGSILAALAVIAFVLLTKGRKIAQLLAVNTLVAWILVRLIKAIIARPRPAEVLPDIVARLEHASGFGFPSGHTTMVTVMALTLMPYVSKKYHWLLWLWIAAVAFSRMYLGVHAPLDIVGGFCVGVIVALSAQLLLKKHGPQR